MLFKKYKGFTLAELMVIMAVLTVLLAAIAPVFTARYKNSSLDFVWQMVGNDNNNDIYTDAPNKSMIQTTFIGASPADGTVAKTAYSPYSKVVIRSSNNLSSGNKAQKQIEFRYGGDKSSASYLFAANSNFFLGGKYNVDAIYGPSDNTAYGSMALNSIKLDTTTVGYNTALGYYALSELTSGISNTAVGYAAGNGGQGYSITTGLRNTLAGYNINTASSAHDDTLIGNNILTNYSSDSNRNTLVGSNIYAKGSDNTVIGYTSSSYGGEGNYNTKIGAYAGGSGSSYTTVVGYNSCAGLEGKNNKTCIGQVDGTKITNNSVESVYIGGPVTGDSTYLYDSASVMEVHNSSGVYGTDGNALTVTGMGNSTVVINGNLIVRGQPYFSGLSMFPYNSSKPNNKYPALMGYYLLFQDALKNYNSDSAETSFYTLSGDDGSSPLWRLTNNAGSDIHQKNTGHEHCICNYSTATTLNSNNRGVSSYDWSSFYKPVNDITSYILYLRYKNNAPYFFDKGNIDLDTSSVVELNNAHGILNKNNASCCPILTGNEIRPTHETASKYSTSDIRLKELTGIFTSGLDELSKLKIYNYTYKSDTVKQIFTGVVAQELKKIFPNAVFKNDKGFYEIRRDEIFYAAINSIKEIYQKVLNLSDRITANIVRIDRLKKDNARLIKQLDQLSNELTELENLK